MSSSSSMMPRAGRSGAELAFCCCTSLSLSGEFARAESKQGKTEVMLGQEGQALSSHLSLRESSPAPLVKVCPLPWTAPVACQLGCHLAN